MEKDRSTGTWQMLVPNTENSCNVFGTNDLARPHRLGWRPRRQCRGLCLEPLAPVQVLPPPRPVVPVRHRLVLLSAMKPKMRFSFSQTHFFCLVAHIVTCVEQYRHSCQAPTEDSLWYYEIGGAEPVSVPANPSVVSVALGGSAQLGLGYSCGKFDPVAAVTNTLNDIRTGVDNMMSAMTAAASAAIAALPALILQRANPGLYDMFQNALLQAQETMQLATKSCEQMEAEIAQGKNPYADLITLSRAMTGRFRWGSVATMR